MMVVDPGLAEFINRNDELWYDLDLFNQKLTGYLQWYNTRRPHHSLDLKPPINYMQIFQT
jgi:transposase InsO family protein